MFSRRWKSQRLVLEVAAQLGDRRVRTIAMAYAVRGLLEVKR